MRFPKFGSHHVRIIEIGKRCIGKKPTRIEHVLRQLANLLLLLICRCRPGKGVIDHADRISVTALKSAADMSRPRHVHT